MLVACSDEDELTTQEQSYGYIQVSLRKASTRSVVEGSTLDYLYDAKKIKLSLRTGGKTIEQTLNLYAPSQEGAELGLTSENLKLMPGDYSLLSYAIYGEYRSGDMPDVLQVCVPEEPTTITVRGGELTRQELCVEAKRYGSFSTTLLRVEPETRAEAIYSDIFNFADIDSVQIVYHRTENGIDYRGDVGVKAIRMDSDRPMFRTEDVQLQEGEYTITFYQLFNKRREFMYAQDVRIPFHIAHHEKTNTEVGVELKMTDGIRDGIALKQIWSAMDGRNWSWHEADGNGGSNWVFTMADGSPRPISAWTNQLGVRVVNGRVVSLNLGSFNPMGIVPDAIGQLSALESLYLGMHTDEVYYQLEGIGRTRYSMNPWEMALKTQTQTQTQTQTRMDIARERTYIRRMAQWSAASARTSRIQYKQEASPIKRLETTQYAEEKPSTYGQNTSDPANRITGISPEIGKLQNLNTLYIANTLIKSLPLELQNLKQLTDLELYNNPLEDVDGEIFRNMKELVLVNFDSFYRMNETQLQAMLDKLCTYCPKVQLLYLNRMGLTHLPDQLKNLTDLRLLDASFNKIARLQSLKPMAPIQVMLNYNELTDIPADFINVADLELFSATDNKLREFPAVLSNLDTSYTIEEVDLTGNRMHGFQSGFKGIRVEKLKVGYNHLGRASTDNYKSEFPREFSETGSEINYFVIAGNNIDSIPNAAVENIKYLQAFDISINNLRYLPGYMDGKHFPYLTGLDCSHNQFRGFPSNVLNVPSLSQLLISEQGYYRDQEETQWVKTMTDWPEYLHLHGSLTNLDMSGNDFRNVVNFPTNLTTLNVRGNPNIRMVIPQWIVYKMEQGLFVLNYDEDQDIKAE